MLIGALIALFLALVAVIGAVSALVFVYRCEMVKSILTWLVVALLGLLCATAAVAAATCVEWSPDGKSWHASTDAACAAMKSMPGYGNASTVITAKSEGVCKIMDSGMYIRDDQLQRREGKCANKCEAAAGQMSTINYTRGWARSGTKDKKTRWAPPLKSPRPSARKVASSVCWATKKPTGRRRPARMACIASQVMSSLSKPIRNAPQTRQPRLQTLVLLTRHAPASLAMSTVFPLALCLPVRQVLLLMGRPAMSQKIEATPPRERSPAAVKAPDLAA